MLFTDNALKSIENYVPNAKTKYLDMLHSFLLEGNSYNVIIADLYLYYFDNETTICIIKEIKRILNEDGFLLARVASVNDVNFGAVGGKVLEKNYYFAEGYNKCKKMFAKNIDIFT